MVDGAANARVGADPADWEVLPLGDLLVLSQYGLSIRGERSGAVPILRMNCQQDGQVVFRNLQFVDLEPRLLSNYRLQDGDLLFNRTNSYELVGRTALFQGEREAVFASYLVRLRVDRTRVHPDFLNLFLNLPSTQERLKGLATRGVSQSNISASKLKTLPVVLPPLDEQWRIAEALVAIQSARKVENERIERLKALRAATMAKLFREGLRGEGSQDTEVGPIPRGWLVSRLKDLLTEPLRNGHSAPASSNGMGIPTFTLTAVTLQDFSQANVKVTTADPRKVEGLWARFGDVFIERANTREMVGLAAHYTGPDHVAIFPDLVIRARVDRERILPEVLVGWLLDERCRAYFRSAARGTASNMPKIDQGVISETLVPVPPLDDQAMVAAISTALNRKIEEGTIRRTRLAQLFESLLGSLMTGAIRLRELHDA